MPKKPNIVFPLVCFPRTTIGCLVDISASKRGIPTGRMFFPAKTPITTTTHDLSPSPFAQDSRRYINKGVAIEETQFHNDRKNDCRNVSMYKVCICFLDSIHSGLSGTWGWWLRVNCLAFQPLDLLLYSVEGGRPWNLTKELIFKSEESQNISSISVNLWRCSIYQTLVVFLRVPRSYTVVSHSLSYSAEFSYNYCHFPNCQNVHGMSLPCWECCRCFFLMLE